MTRAYFNRQEAEAKLGTVIESLIRFSGVPQGTGGTVIRADSTGPDEWTVAIQWLLPTKRPQAIHSQIGDESLVAIETGQPLVDWFSKDEYEKYLKEL